MADQPDNGGLPTEMPPRLQAAMEELFEWFDSMENTGNMLRLFDNDGHVVILAKGSPGVFFYNMADMFRAP